MMTGLGFRHMRSSAFSSDFILTGQAKALVRIQVWDCRFLARLSRLTVVGSGHATGRPNWPAIRVPAAEGDNFDEATRHGAGARFVVELPAFSA